MNKATIEKLTELIGEAITQAKDCGAAENGRNMRRLFEKKLALHAVTEEIAALLIAEEDKITGN